MREGEGERGKGGEGRGKGDRCGNWGLDEWLGDSIGTPHLSVSSSEGIWLLACWMGGSGCGFGRAGCCGGGWVKGCSPGEEKGCQADGSWYRSGQQVRATISTPPNRRPSERHADVLPAVSPAHALLVHNPQSPAGVPTHGLQYSPFAPRLPRMSTRLASRRLSPRRAPGMPLPRTHSPTIHLLLPRPHNGLVRCDGVGGGFEAAVDGAVDCAAEGFTYALWRGISMRGGCVMCMRGGEWSVIAAFRGKDERLTCNPTAALFNPCNVPPPDFPFAPAAAVGPIPGGA